MEQLIEETRQKLQTATDRLKDELKKLRTGRANASMLDGIMVEAYGTKMPLNQTATVAVPDSQLIQVTPFDVNNLPAIASAIRDNQALGLNPMDDGRVVRVPIPPLTEERRRDLVKLVNQKQEETMIALRSIRHDTLDLITRSQKDKEIGEDEANRLQKQVEDLMNKARQQAETITKAKEQEVMTI